MAPFNVFSEVDVETSVQIMHFQGSEEGRTTDVASDHRHEHITWLMERVPVKEEAYEKLYRLICKYSSTLIRIRLKQPFLDSPVYGLGFFIFFPTGCQFFMQTRALQGYFQKCTFQTIEFIVKCTATAITTFNQH